MSDHIIQSAIGRPTCIALDICHHIIDDVHTRHKTLVGVFQSIVVPQIPLFYPQLYVMATLGEGMGHLSVTLSIRAPSGAEIRRMHNEADLAAPDNVVEMVFQILNLPILEPGLYFVDLLLDNAPLASRRFYVHLQQSR